MGAIGGLLILIVSVMTYFLPTIIAYRKHKANTSAITLVNLFLGWTVIGWLVALLWAVSNQLVDDPTVVVAKAPAPPAQASALCASCGKYSHAGMKFCPHCGAAMA